MKSLLIIGLPRSASGVLQEVCEQSTPLKNLGEILKHDGTYLQQRTFEEKFPLLKEMSTETIMEDAELLKGMYSTWKKDHIVVELRRAWLIEQQADWLLANYNVLYIDRDVDDVVTCNQLRGWFSEDWLKSRHGVLQGVANRESIANNDSFQVIKFEDFITSQSHIFTILSGWYDKAQKVDYIDDDFKAKCDMVNCRSKIGQPRYFPLSYLGHREAATNHELSFWQNLDDPWHADDNNMLNVKSIKDAYLRALRAKGIKPIRVLDIGSGPNSVLGNYASPDIHLTAIDPLAHEYMTLESSQIGVRPINIPAESMSEVFPDGYFHIVFASNSIDHSLCPYYVLQQISHVLHEDGFFILHTYQREASRCRYKGLHRHNLVLTEDGKLIEEDSKTDLLSATDLVMLAFQSQDVYKTAQGVFVHERSSTLK